MLISDWRTPTPPLFEVTDEETILALAKIPAESTARTSIAPVTVAAPSSKMACTALRILFMAMIPPTALPFAP